MTKIAIRKIGEPLETFAGEPKKQYRRLLKTKAGKVLAVVYPVGKKGWEYRLLRLGRYGNIRAEYDASYESSVGYDHARTAGIAMKWAKTTAKEFTPRDWRSYE